MKTPVSPNAVCKQEGDYLLIVEGKDDCNSIYHLASQYELQNLFGIWEGGSDEGALTRFGGSLLATSKRPIVLGLILDCDLAEGASSSLERRWAEISYRLTGPGYAVPDKPAINGTIIEGTDVLPKVGIWLMPNNERNGMLEDFLLSLVPPEVLKYTRERVQEAKKDGIASYKEPHESKAVAHTFLAWQDEPGYPLGLGVKAKLFDANNANALAFVDWLRRLFERPK